MVSIYADGALRKGEHGDLDVAATGWIARGWSTSTKRALITEGLDSYSSTRIKSTDVEEKACEHAVRDLLDNVDPEETEVYLYNDCQPVVDSIRSGGADMSLYQILAEFEDWRVGWVSRTSNSKAHDKASLELRRAIRRVDNSNSAVEASD